MNKETVILIPTKKSVRKANVQLRLLKKPETELVFFLNFLKKNK